MPAAFKAFGRRNIAYLVFTGLLFPLAIWLESTGKSSGPDRGGGQMVGLALWGLASLASVAVNVILLIVNLSNKRPVIKELIAIALPFVVVAVVLALEGVLA